MDAAVKAMSLSENATLPPAPEGAPPPPTADAAAWSDAALDEILAPVALFPDPILAQVLAASTNAQEVLDAGNWLIEHPDLKDDALTQAAAEADFSPAVQALVHFPTVVDMMCRELDWTRQLGDAFSADQGAVLASVQRLRKQAADAGNLVSSPEMKVETKQEQGKDVIVVQPANPQIIYVPQYNPVQVYTPPPVTTTTTTTTTASSGISTEQAVVGGLLAFTAGVLVANAFNDNHNDYCYPNWGYGGVYYGPRPYYPHNTFIYAPQYPGYRPAYGYRPPTNYPAHYNNYQRNTVNNVNVNVNNNYFNRFDKNQNRVSTYQPNSPVTRPAGATPYSGANRAGQTNYAGNNAQRPGNAATRPATTPARPPGAAQPRPSGQYAGARPNQGQSASQRPATTQRPAGAQRPPSAQPRPTAAQPRPLTAQQRPTASQRGPSAADRGYPQTTGRRADAGSSAAQRGSTFQGASNRQASSERAASQRGRSSMQGASRPSSRAAPSQNRQKRG